MLTHKKKISLYDRFDCKWVVRNDKDDYDQCYNGVEFVNTDEIMHKKSLASDSDRMLLCGKSTVLLQEPRLLMATNDFEQNLTSFSISVIDMVVGVPGCGKTTFILNNNKTGSLVLTSSAEGAADIRDRLAKKTGKDANEFKENYRTK